MKFETTPPEITQLENGKVVVRIPGDLIIDGYDIAADDSKSAFAQKAVAELEFQVKRSDGTWVAVDAVRVRLATRGVKT